MENGIVAEANGMTKQLRTAEKTGVSSGMKRESEIGEKKEKLDDLLLSAVDETLNHVFREVGTKVIYDYLENSSLLEREEIAEKTKVFSPGLERLLGSATPMIEKMILMNLYRKFELKFEEKKGYEFSDYVKELRKSQKLTARNAKKLSAF